ncbi:MAG: lysylphosphatidylglycerol synthase transmembrane domain-containing protein [Desulfovibrionaceae bacterium]
MSEPAASYKGRNWKLALTLAFTGAVLAALYSLADFSSLGRTLRQGDPRWLGAYLALFVPQLLLAGWRWQRIAGDFGGIPLGFGRAMAQTLGGYSANLVVPGKMGELVKGLWLFVEGRKFLPYFLVVLEKLLDLLATLALLTVALAVILPQPLYQSRSVILALLLPLAVCWVVGLYFLRRIDLPVRLVNRFVFKDDESRLRTTWQEVWGRKRALAVVCGLSLLLWAVQVLQFWCMFRVFGAVVPLDELYAGAPLALLAGILPLTTGGVGTRDAALLWWFGSGLSLELVLSVGILSIVRVVLPGALGLPCFWREMRRRRHA